MISWRPYHSFMNMAVNPPVLPMLAKRVGELPPGEGWIFEPKWDGFRTLIFRDGEEVFIQSRDEKPLNRYFPELIDPLKAQLPKRCVLDGELVIAGDEGLEFETLQMRLHPAESRVKKLAVETPASVVFFDLLCEGNKSLCDAPFGERRARLESLLSSATPPLHLTPATRDRNTAADWFRRFEGAGLDGVVAKPKVGSLLLGLYDESGSFEHVGVCASFTDVKRRELVTFLAPYRENALDGHPWRNWAEAQPDADSEPHRRPGAQSRWSAGKDLSWEPLRPELVVEVAYDHMQGNRFRHTAQFRRWRDDKRPRDCTFDQLEVVPPHELAAIFVTGR